MPTVINRDSDGDAIYSEPCDCEDCEKEGWSLIGSPKKMNRKALCAAVARDILGCKIYWWGYYCDWCCGCKDNKHSCDQQCSAIADIDQLYAPVIKKLNKRGITVAAGPFRKVLEDGLTFWRLTLENIK